ncbi:MAG: hypothetical protein SFW35_03545 [Chitinophagales bacterium]|nr:hypothetical protein [Chitinophagales bacterium]
MSHLSSQPAQPQALQRPVQRPSIKGIFDQIKPPVATEKQATVLPTKKQS